MTAPVMVRGSMRCPVPGCGGMLRPETNGMGRLIEICDDCVTRTQEHARLGHYFRSLERRIAALEAAQPLAAVARRISPSVRPPKAIAPVDGEKPARLRRYRREGPTRTNQILAALREAPTPLTMAEILAALLVRCPECDSNAMRVLVHNLAHRGLLVNVGRDVTLRGMPSRYAIAPTATSAADGDLAGASAAHPAP